MQLPVFPKAGTIGTAALLSAAAWSSSAMAADYEVTVTNLTSGLHFTPVIVAAHPGNVRMFQAGTAASSELQAIAEGGDVGPMAALLGSIGANVETGGGLVAPGASETFTISTTEGNDFLSVASMLLPTNDGFLGLNSLPLRGASGTHDIPGYDAGTEANDELAGSGAPGEPGFPAPPPVVASGTGTGGTGVPGTAEGFVHIHRNVIGDANRTGGSSDINAYVHRWLNPVARVTVRALDATSGPGRVGSLSGTAYSQTAVEIFWEAATSADSVVTNYEVTRDGQIVADRDARSYFEEGLDAATDYVFEVTAIDAQGRRGQSSSVTVTTN